MTWPPHQMTWHASKQVTSPWNSRRLVHSKEMVWASRWSVALRTFYRQILSLLYSSFFFWNFRPRLARELLVFKIHIILNMCVCVSVSFPLFIEFISTNITKCSTILCNKSSHVSCTNYGSFCYSKKALKQSLWIDYKKSWQQYNRSCYEYLCMYLDRNSSFVYTSVSRCIL